MDLSCRGIKLLCKRHLIFFCHLTFANHVHQFDTGQHISGRAIGFKIEHWFGHVLDGTMILLDNIVEIRLSPNDRSTAWQHRQIPRLLLRKAQDRLGKVAFIKNQLQIPLFICLVYK